MQWSRKYARAQQARTTTRFQEHEVAMKLDLALDTQPPVEVQQVDAAAQQDVLAVVDGLAIVTADVIRSRAPAQKGTSLQQTNRVTRIRQCSRRRQSGQAAAHDDYLG